MDRMEQYVYYRVLVYGVQTHTAVRRRGEESRRRISEALAEVMKGTLPQVHTSNGWWPR